MYQTIRDVVLAVREKYEGVTELSRKADPRDPLGEGWMCAYSHETNGVGCAIGCLVDAETADEMDEVVDVEAGSPPVITHPDVFPYLKGIVSDDINPRDLRWLQVMHDGAKDADHFRSRLDIWLESLSDE